MLKGAYTSTASTPQISFADQSEIWVVKENGMPRSRTASRLQVNWGHMFSKILQIKTTSHSSSHRGPHWSRT